MKNIAKIYVPNRNNFYLFFSRNSCFYLHLNNTKILSLNILKKAMWVMQSNAFFALSAKNNIKFALKFSRWFYFALTKNIKHLKAVAMLLMPYFRQQPAHMHSQVWLSLLKNMQQIFYYIFNNLQNAYVSHLSFASFQACKSNSLFEAGVLQNWKIFKRIFHAAIFGLSLHFCQ